MATHVEPVATPIIVIADPALGVQVIELAYTDEEPSYQVMLSPAFAVIVTALEVMADCGA